MSKLPSDFSSLLNIRDKLMHKIIKLKELSSVSTPLDTLNKPS